MIVLWYYRNVSSFFTSLLMLPAGSCFQRCSAIFALWAPKYRVLARYFWYNTLMIQHEFRESCDLNSWLEGLQFSFPELRGFHVANENPGRNKAERARLGALRKRMGVKAGVCDWFFFYPPDIRIAIELKKSPLDGKSSASASELDWLKYFSRCGFESYVCHGWQEAAECVEQALKSHGVNVSSSLF